MDIETRIADLKYSIYYIKHAIETIKNNPELLDSKISLVIKNIHGESQHLHFLVNGFQPKAKE